MRNGHIKNPCPLFVNMESLFFEKSTCPDIAVPGTPKLQKIGQDESQVCIKPVAMTWWLILKADMFFNLVFLTFTL